MIAKMFTVGSFSASGLVCCTRVLRASKIIRKQTVFVRLNMKRIASVLLTMITLVTLACGQGSPEGQVLIYIGSGQTRSGTGTAIDLAYIEVIASATDMSEIRATATEENPFIKMSIPSGTQRLFTASAYNSAGKKVLSGRTTADVPAGANITITITLKFDGPAIPLPGSVLIRVPPEFLSEQVNSFLRRSCLLMPKFRH
jgi:hypothetical protein